MKESKPLKANDLKRSDDDKQLDGGPDLDTTNLDKPSSMERQRDDLLTIDDHEYGPETTVTIEETDEDSLDPSGEDPFIPGTEETRDPSPPEERESKQEKKRIERLHHRDPKGDDGPTYEAHQGNADQSKGGSVDPNDSLTEDTSGLQRPPKS